LYLKTITYCFR